LQINCDDIGDNLNKLMGFCRRLFRVCVHSLYAVGDNGHTGHARAYSIRKCTFD